MAGGRAKSSLKRTKRQDQGPLRKSARLEQRRQQQSTAINQVTKPKPAFSSIRKNASRRQQQSTAINQATKPKPTRSLSSASHAFSKKTSQKSPFSPEAVTSSNSLEAVNPTNSFEAVTSSNSPEAVNPPNSLKAVNPPNSLKAVNPPNSPEAVNPTNPPVAVNPTNSFEAVTSSNSLEAVNPPDSPEAVNPPDSPEAVNPPNSLETVNPTNPPVVANLPNSPTVVSLSNSSEKKKLYDNPIEHWRNTGTWPKKYFLPDPDTDQQRLIRKRPSSIMSYAQGVKKGKNPPAYTPQYEKQVLNPAGIFLTQQYNEAAICDDCKTLCDILIVAEYEPPDKSLFEGDLYIKVLIAVRNRNEARVMRDLFSCLVPSAELLFMNGLSKNEALIEEVQGEWKKSIPLVGPVPRPEFAVGFQSSAFTIVENTKLKKYAGPKNPTLFTQNLYFPFLICEVKCGAVGLDIADRQNARSASTAANAILQLYQAVSRAEQLHRKILVFSISHDNSSVRIYGHYVLIKNKTTFHQHFIRFFSLLDNNGENKWKAYNFVRKLYDHFAPIHLQRIQDALALLEVNVEDDSNKFESELLDSRESVSTSESPDYSFTGSTQSRKRKRLNKDAVIAELQKNIERQRQEFTKREDQLKEESKRRHEELVGQNMKLLDILSKR